MWRHVYPIDDLIEHNTGIVDADYCCQCNPKYDWDNCIIIHDAMDRRESFQGEERHRKTD